MPSRATGKVKVRDEQAGKAIGFVEEAWFETSVAPGSRIAGYTAS